MAFRFEPLNPRHHQHLHLLPERDFRFAERLTRIDLMANEIWQAANHFPVIFVQSTASDALPPKPVMVVARPGQRNRLVGNDGRWRHPLLPILLRIYPFSLHRQGEETKVVIDADAALFCRSGPHPLFAPSGRPSTDLEKILALLQVVTRSLDQTDRFTAALQQMDLLRPICDSEGTDSAFAPPFQYLHVPPERLAEISTSRTILLRRQGWLALIYAHMISLERDLSALEPLFWQPTTPTEPA